MSDFNVLVKMIQKGDIPGTQKIVKEYLNNEASPQDIIQKGLVIAMEIVGNKFSSGECFIPEMLIAARASQKCLDILKPLIKNFDLIGTGKVVIGTVKGDLHDIGKNIVSMVLESSGFEVVDLGVDVFPEKFIESIEKYNPDILALSCLLTTTKPAMQLTIEKLVTAGIRDKVKVIIGGPPISDEFAEKIGADYYGQDAFAGLKIARKVVS